MESTETEMDRTVNRGAGAFEKSSQEHPVGGLCSNCDLILNV